MYDHKKLTIEELCNRYPGVKNRLNEMNSLAEELQIVNQVMEEQYTIAKQLCRDALQIRWTNFDTLSDVEKKQHQSPIWCKQWYKSIFQTVCKAISPDLPTILKESNWLKTVFKAAISIETVLLRNSWSNELSNIDDLIFDDPVTDLEPQPTVNSQSSPPAPSPFDSQTKLAKIPTGAPMVSSTYSFLYKWKEQSGYPYYRYSFGSDKEQERYVQTYIIDPESDLKAPLALQGHAAWEIADRLGTMHAYIHLLLGAYAMKQPNPWMSKFRITGRTFIERLNLLKRNHKLTIPQHLASLVDLCNDINRVGMNIYWPQGKNNFTLTKTRLWHMDIDYHGHFKQYSPGAELTDFTLSVYPGTWAEKFLNSKGSEEEIAFFQYGVMTETILSLDPIHQRELVRLVLHLLFDARMRRLPNTTYSMAQILTMMFSQEEVLQAQSDRSLRRKMIKTLQEDLLTLKETLHFGVSFPFSFPVELLPPWALVPRNNSLNDSQQSILPRNYWSQLLEQTIDIVPPLEVTKQLPAWKNKPSDPEPSIKKPTFSFQEIKAARIASGLSIREMAKLLGRSKAWIQKLESGKIIPKSDDIAHIKTVLKL